MCMLVIGSVSRKGLCLSGTNKLHSQTSLLSVGVFDWDTILHTWPEVQKQNGKIWAENTKLKVSKWKVLNQLA